MKNMLMISNMYPSKKNPHYGAFVKNTYHLVNRSEGIYVKKVVMHMHKHRMVKLLAYCMWYIKIILFGVFGKYDCIYAHYVSHSSFPVRVIKAVKKRMVIIENAHGEDVLAEEKCYEKNIKRSASVLEVTDLVIVPSNYYSEVVNKSFGIPFSKIFVYPSGGIDRSIFHIMDKNLCKRYFQSNEEFVIGFAARIEQNKGWKVFLEALKLLEKEKRTFEVMIIGSGSDEDLLQKELRDSGLKDISSFYSAMPQRELALAYNAMDVICCCSTRKSESLGLVGLEAMASGCECILSSAPGHLTYAKDGYNAHIFEQKNVKMLADKIAEVMDETKSKKKEIISNALETADMYDSRRVTSDLINKIEKELGLGQGFH